MNAIYQLEACGIDAFDVFTKSGRFAAVMVQGRDGKQSLFWDSNCSKGSARKFATRAEALEFMHQRRIKKGWRVQ